MAFGCCSAVECGEASLKYVPYHRQIEQPAKCPPADPHWLRRVEPQAPEPRKNAGQCHVGDHRARSKSAGAIMRAGAEGDAFGGIARDVEDIGIAKAGLVVRGDTAGNIAARSDMCASPSLRIMLWPISVFINPAGWCDENTSVRFSWLQMSSRRVNTVEPSCGTNAIGASRRIFASAG